MILIIIIIIRIMIVRIKALLEPVFEAAAAEFDRVAVICHKASCNGQLERWPARLRSRVVLVRAEDVNRRKGLDELRLPPGEVVNYTDPRQVSQHSQLVTQSHAEAWELLRDNGTKRLLVLEADYREVAHVLQRFEEPEYLMQFDRFLGREDWNLLRLGYTPTCSADENPNATEVRDAAGRLLRLNWSRCNGHCDAACECARSPTMGDVCSMPGGARRVSVQEYVVVRCV